MTGPAPETRRIVACMACDGAGYVEHYDGGRDWSDGSPTGYREDCHYCGGTGEEEITAEPITLEDLEAEAFAEAFARTGTERVNRG
jgi:hypothetical protein